MSPQILISLIGLMFNWRIEHKIAEKITHEVLQLHWYRILWTSKVICLLFFPVLFREHVLLMTISTAMISIPSPFWLQLKERFFPKMKKAEDLHVVDILLISLKSGKSLRESVALLRERIQADQMILSDEIENQLGLLIKNSERVLDRLKSLKTKIEVENKLRHKSSQALLQTRIQAWVVVFLFVILCFILPSEFRPSWNDPLFVTSSTLISAGVFWIQRMGRKIAWKV